MTAGKHRRTETSEFVAFVIRLFIAWGDRIAKDPAALVHLRELQTVLTEQTNRGIFLANQGADHYSQNDMGAILGISRQGVAKRIALGETAHAALIEARGGGAVIRLGDIRRERARLLDDAGLADLTGSEREREQYRAVGQ